MAKRGRTVFGWVLSALLAALYLLAGMPKLIGAEGVAQMFAGWGYADWFMRLVGLLEVLGAVLLLVPRTVLCAIALLGVLMLGAVVTHVRAEEGLQVLRPIVFLALLAAAGWLRRPRSD